MQYQNQVTKNFVNIDRSRDDLLTDFSKKRLEGGYLLDGESYQDCFARVATSYADNPPHAQRLYDYISTLWFMPATPVLSNAGTTRGLPISCFLSEVQDSLENIFYSFQELGWLAAKGGGTGVYWGNLRSIGESVGKVGKTSGPIPFIKMQESQSLAISQGSLRRGSSSAYMPIWHPEIEEFISLRKPTGGDRNRKTLELHHAVVIDDAFMEAVQDGEKYFLRSPKDHSVVSAIDARTLWFNLLSTRLETGEPYILFIDNVNKQIPKHHRMLGLEVKMSNLCSEIHLPTGVDYLDKERSAVCCLSSVNLEKWDEWKDNKKFIEDIYRFLDNVLQDFIDSAPVEMGRAKYSARMERSVGLGVMGFHGFLQKKGIPWESVSAKTYNKQIFEHLRHEAIQASKALGKEKGNCPDFDAARMLQQGTSLPPNRRFSYVLAVAPTASISIICGEASPSIEPRKANAYIHELKNGFVVVRNKYLEDLLENKGQNTEEVWASIVQHNGSVQHLHFLTQDEKDTFKTAMEIDQRWLIDFAGDRSIFIDQGQSLNIFLPPDVHKNYLHKVHFEAWKKGVKSLYYCHSDSVGRGEYVGTESRTNDYEECIACT